MDGLDENVLVLALCDVAQGFPGVRILSDLRDFSGCKASPNDRPDTC